MLIITANDLESDLDVFVFFSSHLQNIFPNFPRSLRTNGKKKGRRALAGQQRVIEPIN